MNLEEIENSLPNGFHDALIEGISVDYVARTIVISMQLSVGGPSDDENEREAYCEGLLTISQFLLCVIEPPDRQYPYANPEAVRVNSGPGNPQAEPFLQDLPPGTFSHWFYVNEWNSFIYIVARGAKLDLGPFLSA